MRLIGTGSMAIGTSRESCSWYTDGNLYYGVVTSPPAVVVTGEPQLVGREGKRIKDKTSEEEVLSWALNSILKEGFFVDYRGKFRREESPSRESSLFVASNGETCCFVGNREDNEDPFVLCVTLMKPPPEGGVMSSKSRKNAITVFKTIRAARVDAASRGSHAKLGKARRIFLVNCNESFGPMVANKLRDRNQPFISVHQIRKESGTLSSAYEAEERAADVKDLSEQFILSCCSHYEAGKVAEILSKTHKLLIYDGATLAVLPEDSVDALIEEMDEWLSR